jgi:uncharacterized delta-60 repeat protein
MALQADGKIVVLGDDTNSTSGTQFDLARFNSNGTLDTTFGSGGLVRPGVYGWSGGVAVQSDGKIVAVGTYVVVNGIYTYYYLTMARFNPDGSLNQELPDTYIGGTQSWFNTVAIQSDGKIVIGGYWSSGTPNTDFITVRYNSDFTRDYTWNGGVVDTSWYPSSASISQLAIQPNGEIVAAGSGGNGVALARYTPTGAPDFAVSPSTAYGAMGRAVALEPDGKIIVAGQANLNGGDFLVVRFNYDGTLDSTFGPGTGYVTTDFGSGAYDNANAVLLQPDGKIVAAGQGNGTDFGLARYLNGTPPAPASTLGITGFPSYLNSGQAQTFTVTALDAHQNIATGYTGTIHFTSSDPSAGLPADYTFTSADQGVHTFTATLQTTGTQSLTATDTATGGITGSVTGIQVNPAYLLVSGFPSPTMSGVAQNYTVTAENANGTTATAYTGTIYFLSSDLHAVLPFNYTYTASDAGVHTFSGTLETIGTQSITATDTIYTSVTGTQSGIVVQGDTPAVTGMPSPSVSGSPGTFTVTMYDPSGHVATGYTGKVHFSSSDTAAVLPADYTFTTSDVGVHTFSATLETAGTQSLTATDPLTTASGTLTGILVDPSSFSLTAPATTTAGVALTLTVQALNANGSNASAYTGTVHFTSSDSQAVLPADYTFTSSDAGSHSFSVTLKTAGTQTATATDTAVSSVTGTSNHIQVSAAATSVFSVSGFPSPTTAGVSQSFTVAAQDAYGNTATGYRGTVKFSSSDTQAGLPSKYTFISSDNGIHSFTATLKTAGTQTLTATDVATSSITGTESGISVNPAAAKTLGVTGYPSPRTAGVAHNFTVTAKDAFGNVATGYTGTVQFLSSDGKAVLPSNYTFVAADAGVHSFSAILKTAKTQSITAKDTVTSSIAGSQTGITVTPAAASQIRVSASSSATAGTAFNVTLTAQDPYGNTATSYTGTVHFTSSDQKAVLPANYTFTSSDAGTHTFTNGATLKTAGKQTITATDTVTSSITGTATVSVTAAAASTFSVSAPSSVTAGAAFTVTVTAQDAYGNRATGYRGTAHFTSSDSKAVLPADYTFTATDSGSHSFSNGATLKTAGTQSITATDTVTSTITGQASIKVNAAAASVLVVSGFPSPIAHGTAANFTVTAQDAYGNVATGYRGTVHFTSSDAAAALPANYAFTSADAGVHTFTATLNTVGTQSITATDTIHSGITGTQSNIQVTATPAAVLLAALQGGREARRRLADALFSGPDWMPANVNSACSNRLH